jgi:hypothetical protein
MSNFNIPTAYLFALSLSIISQAHLAVCRTAPEYLPREMCLPPVV